MAFNNSQNQAIIDTGLSSASRGQAPNDAYGELFKGLGQTLATGLNAYDDATRTKIELAADQAVNQTVEANMPSALQDGINNLNSLQSARMQGKISETKFLTDLAMQSKRLRSMFPTGYGPQVEAAIASAAGASTANDLRKARLAEMQASAVSGDAELKNMREFTEAENNQTYLLDPTVNEHFKTLTNGMSVEQFLANPDLALFPQLKIAIADRKAYDAQLDRVKNELDTNQKLTDKKASDVVDRFVGNAFNETINKDYGDFIAVKAKASDPNSPGGAEWTSEEEQLVAQTFQKFRVSSISNMEGFLSGTKASDEARDKLRKRMTTRLDAYQEMLSNGQMGMLGAASRAFKGQMDEASRKLIGSSDIMAAIALAKEAGVPPEVINNLFINEANSGVMKNQLMSPSVLGIISGRNSLSTTLDNHDEYTDNMAPVTKSIMDQLSYVLNSPVNTPEGVAAAAVNIFSKQNEDFTSRIAPESRAMVFEQLLSPVVVEQLKKSGNEQALAFAMNWGTKQFDAITKRARDIALEGASTRSYIDVKFDGEKFVVTPRQPGIGESLTTLPSPIPGWEWAQSGEVVNAVSDLNRYMAVMKPLWEVYKIEPATAMAHMMGDINAVQKNPTFLQSLGGALWNFIAGEAKADEKQPGAKPSASSGSIPAQNDVVSYIRKAAVARGIDPEVALAVANSEGLKGDPKEGWQSKVVKNGKREPSYGPFQLYLGGGIGNRFVADTGLDPTDPSTVFDQIDYALDVAANEGWGQWYGSKAVGIAPRQGLENARSLRAKS